MHPILVHTLAIAFGYLLWNLVMSGGSIGLYFLTIINTEQLKMLVYYLNPIGGIFVAGCVLFQSLRQ